jgi:hypothetical protein
MWKWIALVEGLLLAVVTAWAFAIVLPLAMEEEICLDRWPVWGPPEDPEINNGCSGHMWERHEAGYPWFGPGPK